MIKLKELVEPKPLEFPDGFKPAKVVPEGGAMCANCANANESLSLAKNEIIKKLLRTILNKLK